MMCMPDFQSPYESNTLKKYKNANPRKIYKEMEVFTSIMYLLKKVRVIKADMEKICNFYNKKKDGKNVKYVMVIKEDLSNLFP